MKSEQTLKNGDRVSLKEYLSSRIDSLEKLTDERFKASLLAINKAEEAQQLRNEAQNEWRQKSKDREGSFTLRSEMERTNQDIKVLQLTQANLAGKANQSSLNVAFLLNVIAIVVSLISIFLHYTKP